MFYHPSPSLMCIYRRLSEYQESHVEMNNVLSSFPVTDVYLDGRYTTGLQRHSQKHIYN